jgi:hypothetical protein
MAQALEILPLFARSVALIPALAIAACTVVPEGSGPSARAAPIASRALYDRSAPAFGATDQLCYARLTQAQVRYTPLPDQHFGGGCTALSSVKLLDFGVPATNLGAMTCALAANFTAWARYGVQPAARLILGSDIVRIETFGTYNCRPIAGSDRLSEHAHSNAVDISAFVLADGRRISVRNGWEADPDTQRFLRVVRASACKRFRTVLSPDYNAAHQDHLHFDMGGEHNFCR